MTLIVGQFFENEFFLVSDSQAFYPDQRRTDPLDVIVKLVNFQGFIVGFAGLIDVTHRHLGTLKHDVDFDEVEASCIELSARYNNRIDFVFARYGGHTFRILKNGVLSDAKTVWLGSHAAFERLQSLKSECLNEQNHVGVEIVKQESRNNALNEAYYLAVSAMRKTLISSPGEAGGMVIPFCSTSVSSNFGYYVYTSNRFVPETNIGEVWQTVNLGIGDTTTGSFSIGFCGSRSGYDIYLAQLGRKTSYHSPFLDYEAPPKSPFTIQD